MATAKTDGTKTPRTKRIAKTEVSENAASNETPKSATPAGPLLVWTRDPEAGDPPAFVQIGMHRFDLPDAETQRAGFAHEAAQRIVRAVPGYKLLKEKGAK